MGRDKNLHAGHRQRMRRRYEENGFENWAEHEVLEFMLFDCIPRKDTNELAHTILKRFGSIENVFKADPKQLMQIKGVGAKTAEYIHEQEKVYNFCKSGKKALKKKTYSPEKAGEFFMPLFEDMSREMLYMICLDARNNIIRSDCVFEGTFENVNFNTGSLVKVAILADAYKVVIAHNHPSGVLIPSEADIAATEVIIKSLAMFGIKLEEHIIVTDEGCIGIIANNFIKRI